MKCLIKEIINGKDNTYNAIKNGKKIIYQSDSRVILSFQNDVKLIRETAEFIIKFNFTKNKADILFKENSNVLDLDISTKIININDNEIFIKYEVLTTNEKVNYKLEVYND